MPNVFDFRGAVFCGEGDVLVLLFSVSQMRKVNQSFSLLLRIFVTLNPGRSGRGWMTRFSFSLQRAALSIHTPVN
jgi:hypothetical protein